MIRKFALVVAVALFPGVAFGAAADPSSTVAHPAVNPASPWDQAFEAFAVDDESHPHAAGGVLFVGSSSIRLWSDLQDQFKDLPVVINRGFGGSQLADCVKNLNRLVIRYRPSTVLVYAGDNDLAAGITPEEVLHRFASFVEGVHRELPDTRIAYISIKPSPLRIGLLPQIRQTNTLIRDYTEGLDRVAFIDVYTPMLDPSGKPRGELFRADLLHLNADGYERTSPVKAFPPNGYGLHDMAGNAWEWCADWYRPDYYQTSPRRNPKKPTPPTMSAPYFCAPLARKFECSWRKASRIGTRNFWCNH